MRANARRGSVVRFSELPPRRITTRRGRRNGDANHIRVQVDRSGRRYSRASTADLGGWGATTGLRGRQHHQRQHVGQGIHRASPSTGIRYARRMSPTRVPTGEKQRPWGHPATDRVPSLERSTSADHLATPLCVHDEGSGQQCADRAPKTEQIGRSDAGQRAGHRTCPRTRPGRGRTQIVCRKSVRAWDEGVQRSCVGSARATVGQGEGSPNPTAEPTTARGQRWTTYLKTGQPTVRAARHTGARVHQRRPRTTATTAARSPTAARRDGAGGDPQRTPHGSGDHAPAPARGIEAAAHQPAAGG